MGLWLRTSECCSKTDLVGACFTAVDSTHCMMLQLHTPVCLHFCYLYYTFPKTCNFVFLHKVQPDWKCFESPAAHVATGHSEVVTSPWHETWIFVNSCEANKIGLDFYVVGRRRFRWFNCSVTPGKSVPNLTCLPYMCAFSPLICGWIHVKTNLSVNGHVTLYPTCMSLSVRHHSDSLGSDCPTTWDFIHTLWCVAPVNGSPQGRVGDGGI